MLFEIYAGLEKTKKLARTKQYLYYVNMLAIARKAAEKPKKTPEVHGRKIIHIDMDCFYAAVEERDNPELKGRPVAVGGFLEGRGVVSAANYEARKYGVRSALSSAVAIERCPHLVLVHPDMQKYKEESKKIRAIFENYTDRIEPLSLDEAYLDVTGLELFRGSATLLAAQIRKEIYQATGLTASAGIAPNKFLAKVASDWNKPDGQFAVSPEKVDSFIVSLPVEKIWGVGKVTAKKIHELGVSTCGELQSFSRSELKNRFGKFGVFLYDICRGIDEREVNPSRERKSLSIERTFGKDISALDELLEKMPSLYEQFQTRLSRATENFTSNSWRRDPVKTLFIKIKFSDFSVTTVERSFGLVEVESFIALLREGLARNDLPVRLLGLGVRFKPEPKFFCGADGQLLLFERDLQSVRLF